MNKKHLFLFLGLFVSLMAMGENPLWMRYPAISPDGTQIAFTYKGDIYKVATTGGDAVRLTTHSAYDNKPIWSPDGEKIAFVSDRNGGNIDIYIMSSKGGVAKQLTSHSANETLQTFTPDGKHILFTAHYQDPAQSAIFPTARLNEMYQVPVDGGQVEQILAFPADNIQYSKDGKSIIFQDIKGFENTWRKHHTSSVTRDIVKYDFDKKTYSKLIDRAGEDTNPVYAPDEQAFYYLSEQSGSYNVFKADFAKLNAAKQLTHFKEHPVRFLSIANNGTLCYGFDGEIYIQKNDNDKPQRVNIKISNDINDEQLKKMNFSSGATSAINSPDGKQVAFIVRGEVFVTSTDYTTTKQITNTAAQESSVDFGKDNRSLVYSSYRDGYWNVYLAKIARDEEPNFPNATIITEEELIPGDLSEKQNPLFSPNGNEVAFVKDRTKLMVYNLKTKKTRQITDGKYQHEANGSMTYDWSPDGKWFVVEYVSNVHSPYSDVGIVSAVDGGDIFNITNSGYINGNARWVMDGNAILFSTEEFGMRSHASWGAMEDVMIAFMNREAYNKFKMSKEEYELFTESEKESAKEEKIDDKKENKKKKDEKPEKKEKTINIEFDNLLDRIVRLTPHSSRLGDAIINKEGTKLYYLAAFEKDYDMWVYDLRERSTKLLSKINSGYAAFSTDESENTLFVLSGRNMQKMSFANDKFTPISYRAEMELDLTKEREAMFEQVYREERERFYQVDMHGVDWEKLTQHYRKFIPHINNNYDYSEMLSELLGELNVSHTGSGYRAPATGKRTAELGLFVSQNSKEGLLVDEILIGGPFDSFKSKLKVGDIIEKIDNESISKEIDYHTLLSDKAGKNTLISIYSPSENKRWEEVIKPIGAGALNDILYKRWVKQRADEVDRLSNGRLGYVHIASMDDASFRKMYSDALGKYYQKEGMVIDIRYNGGGRLHEDIEMFFNSSKYLDQEIRGKDYCEMPSKRWNKPSIMLMTEADYSNAHGTPWVYKHLGIGKLVGMPVPGTMTSVNWVTLQDPTLYFGIPVVGYRTAEGTYLENSQLEPDIKISLDLLKALEGEDTQIAVSVRELLKEIDGK